jgi:PAS domain S-box-containing protein
VLGEFLDEVRRPLLHRLSARAAPDTSLREGLPNLVDALTLSLRHGRVEPVRSELEPEVAIRAYNLIRDAVFDLVQDCALAAPLHELRVVSDWLAAGISEAAEECATRIRRLSALLDAVPDHVALVGRRGGVIYANRAALMGVGAATGVPSDEIIGRDSHELGLPQDLVQQFQRERDEAVAGHLVTAEALFPTPDGGRWREENISPVYRDGEVEAVAIVSRDIHARKQAQNRLQLLSKLSLLLEASNYEDVLGAMAQVSIPELADWCVVDVVEDRTIRRAKVAHRDPEQADLAAEILRTPLPASYRECAGRDPLSGRSRLIVELTDEKLRELSPTEAYYRLIRRVGGRSLMAVPSIVQGNTIAITTFITTSESRHYCTEALAVAEELARRAAHFIENARLHQRLEESDHRFRVALANSKIAVFEQDLDLRYRWYYNPSYYGAEAVGKMHHDLYAQEDAERLTSIKRRVLETGQPAREEIHLSFLEEGHEMLLAVDPLRDAGGAIAGVIGSATDITAAKRARQELGQALEIREQVMGVLGHDLRNPLTAISVSAALLIRNDGLPDQARRAAARIDRAARRMAELIGTLLDVTESRSQGTLQLSIAATDLHEVCRRVVEELLAARPDRAIELNLNGDGRGQWDGARLAQVVSNLVGNALTYGADSHPVRVSVDSEAGRGVLRVNNGGPVIPPQVIPGLFEPFRRGPSERSSRGLGLGLYIVRQIVLAHKGTIAVESSASNGTTFTVRLPR